MKMVLSSWFQPVAAGTNSVLLRAGRDVRSGTEAIAAAAYIVRSKDGSQAIRIVYSHTDGKNKVYRFDPDQAESEVKVAASFIKETNSGRMYVLLMDEYGEGIDGRWVDKSLMVHPGSSRKALADINAFAGRRILVPTAKALHRHGEVNTTPPDLPVPGRPAGVHHGHKEHRENRRHERRMSGHRNRRRHVEAPATGGAWKQAAAGEHKVLTSLAAL